MPPETSTFDPSTVKVDDLIEWRTARGWRTTGTVREIHPDKFIVTKYFNANAGFDKKDKKYPVKKEKVIRIVEEEE